VIGDRDAFLSAIDIGAPHAEQGAIVTFGAKPDEPNTQYGYIEADEGRAISDGSFAIARFVEKPDAATAAQFLQTGRFFWNSGIFLAKASTLLEEMRQFLPSSLAAISRAIANASADGALVRPDVEAFSQAENISIDHGIMEKTARGMVVPVQMDWSDVGSWDAVWKLGAKDAAGNVIQGNVVTIGTTESLVRNEGGLLVATVGLDKMAVVAVPDAVLIAPLDRVSEVKEIVAALQRHDRDYLASPAKSLHPWGSCETVQFALGPTVRRIVVAPGKAMQVHNQLPSNWTVTSGTAELAVGDEITILRKGHSIQLPGGERRSVTNRGDSPLELVEVELRS
jgi:Mannose-1-phosphate guanylyltransferase